MSTDAVASAIREQINDALKRLRIPAERIDNQLSGGQMAPPQSMPGGGYAPRPHQHDATDIDAGVLDPARIPELLGDVTGPIDATVVSALAGATLDLSGATSGYVITYDGASWVAGPQTGSGGGGGTVVSVGLSLPSIFTVSGSPVTISGTLTGALATQSANTVFAGPLSGADAAPTFRSLVASDLPVLAGDVTGPVSATYVAKLQGTAIIASGATNNDVLMWDSGALSWAPQAVATAVGAQAAHALLIGPLSGPAALPTWRTLVASDLPAGTGTVTSVGLAMPAMFTVTGSPVTSTGTLTATLATQAAHAALIGPASGSAAPTFRALAIDDLPITKGTWTPTYTGSTTAGTTTYTTQSGQYWLIGKICLYRLRVAWTAASGTGIALVSLPFTIAAGADAAAVFYPINVTFPGAGVIGAITPGTNYILLASPASNANPTAIPVEAAGDLIASGWYETV